MPYSIVCLGWGSLIWKPAARPGAPLDAQGVLPGLVDRGGSWRTDGPRLPLELARTAVLPGDASARYVSWVIAPGASVSPVLWAPLALDAAVAHDLDRAQLFATDALARREGIAPSQVGRWPRAAGAAPGPVDDAIGAWASRAGHDAVVWTALLPKWHDAERTPSEEEVLRLLASLAELGTASHAEEYVRRTPRQTTSPYRTALERRLGWTPTDD